MLDQVSSGYVILGQIMSGYKVFCQFRSC